MASKKPKLSEKLSRKEESTINSEIKSVMVSVFALAIAAGIGTFNASSIQIATEQIEEQKFEAVDVFTTLENNREKLNSMIDFPSQTKYNDKILIDANNLQGEAIYKLQQDLNNTKSQLNLINNKMIIIEALQNKVTQAVPQQEEMFSLVLLKSDGNYVPSGEYLQAETIYISGKYDGTATKFDITFKKAGQSILERSGLSMPTDGVFSYYFNANHDQPTGDYTVTVIINGKTDTISFEIV